MSNETFAVIALTVSIIGIIALVAVAAVLLRRFPVNSSADLAREIKEHTAKISRLAEAQEKLESALAPYIMSYLVPDNPIVHLSFRESFNMERFTEFTHNSVVDRLNQLLLSRAGDEVMLTVNGLRLLPSGVEMTVTTSQRGQILIEEGKAVIARHGDSGLALPLVKDAQTGQIIEHMKEAPVAAAFSNLAAISTLVVGAAHLIASSDIAKRLSRVESKLELFSAYRYIDQLATLERIYTSSKELLNGAIDPNRSWELWRLRGELRELRLAWRREFEHRLTLVEDPNETVWLERMFTTQARSDKSIHDSIREGEEQLLLIEYSLRLDHVLAVVSGTLKEFENTLAGELSELQSATDLLNNKGSLISGKFPELTVEPMAAAMTEIVEQYRNLLPEVRNPSKTVIGGPI